MSRETLARRQAALVEALVAGGAVPPGFDPVRVRATREALLRKRAAEVAAVWPALRVSLGPRWTEMFRSYAGTRPTHGATRDGWDLARWAAARGELDTEARRELAAWDAGWRYDGHSPPRRRRLAALRRVARLRRSGTIV